MKKNNLCIKDLLNINQTYFQFTLIFCLLTWFVNNKEAIIFRPYKRNVAFQLTIKITNQLHFRMELCPKITQCNIVYPKITYLSILQNNTFTLFALSM